MAAVQGLIGMLWVNAPTALNVAPWGGAARRLGTNPHAVAVPGPNATVAMSHDFATSVVAEGKLQVKFNRGEKVAARHHAQRTRRAVDRPARVLRRPARLPAHGRRATRATASRSPSRSSAASSRVRDAARPDEGPVFATALSMMCLDPGRFLPPAISTLRSRRCFGFVRSAPLAGGAEEILIPGEPEERTARERRAGGVPIDDETWRQITDVRRRGRRRCLRWSA